MIQGVDVFSGYGRINWAMAAAAGVRFAWVKCTEGNEPARNDSHFIDNVAGCRQNGILVGAYHYAYPLPDDPNHPGRGPEEQAERAFAVSCGLGSQGGELAHALDAEYPEPGDFAKWGCTRPQVSEWLRRYCVKATELCGRKPVIYTYPSWWRWLAAGSDVSWASAYLLWLADYGHPGPGTPPDNYAAPHLSWVSPTWDDWAVCQYSAEGSAERIPGIPACPLDRDCIRTEAMLMRLAGYDTAPTEPAQAIVHPLPGRELDDEELYESTTS